ncbi:MAG: tetratricopeptide repeat protein, partial [bacterium]
AEFLEKSGHGKEASARYEKGVKTALALKDKKGGGVRHLLEAAYRASLRVAALRFGEGDCAGALRMLAKIPRESEPEEARAEVASLRAECALRGGDDKEAELYFRKVLMGGRLPALAARARFQLAAIAEKRGDREEALRRWEDALPLLPARLRREARLRAGQLKRALGDSAGARALLLPLARDREAKAPRRRSVWLLLAGDAAAAERWEEAEKFLDEWSAQGPSISLEGLRLWATVRFRAGRCPPAIEAAHRAIAMKPGPPARLELHRMIGACLLRAGQYDEAAEALREVIRLDPGAADALLGLAETLERIGKEEKAAGIYAEFVELHPGNPRRGEAALRLARLRMKRGEGEAALAAYRIAARSPLSRIAEAARYRLARSLEQAGKADKALAAYESISGGKPGGSRWRRAASWRAAALLERRGKWKKALALYRAIAKLAPSAKGEVSAAKGGASAGKGGESGGAVAEGKPGGLAGEAAQAAARARQLEGYIEANRLRDKEISEQKPLFR